MRIALAWVDLGDPTDRAVALNLARELSRRGHAVELVGPRLRAGEASRELKDGFPVHRVGAPWLARLPVLADAVAAAGLARLDASARYDLWHCHVFGRSHRAFLWAARLRRFRPLVTLHLVLEDYLRFAGGRAGLAALLRQARAVTTVSEANRRELEELLPELAGRAKVVYSYGPLPRFERTPTAGAGKFILCAARLAPYKGQDLLLMAYAAIAEELPGLKLMLCGRDQLRGGLLDFAARLGLSGRVQFTGELPPAELSAALRDCLFFVLPSRRDNFPMALLEAMSEGKAVLATAVGGVPELLRDGVDGLLVAPNDVRALGSALRRLALDAELRDRLGRSARERARAFSWRRAAEDYEALYA